MFPLLDCVWHFATQNALLIFGVLGVLRIAWHAFQEGRRFEAARMRRLIGEARQRRHEKVVAGLETGVYVPETGRGVAA